MTVPDPRAPTAGPRAGGPSRPLLLLAGVAVLALGVVAFFAAGSGTSGGTPRQQLRAWVSGTGLGGALGLLVADDRTVAGTLAAGRGSGAVHADCALLVVDAEAANGSLPSPDRRLTALLSAAYGKEDSAGADCYAAGSSNRPLLARSAGERAAGRSLIGRALARVRAVSGVTVPTTTSTEPGGGASG